MRITIHRGTNQIGGCVTEIESNGYKVFIDFGENLPGSKNEVLPPIEGLTYGDFTKSGLFITHYHGDHIGKIYTTAADVPIFVGETALEIFKHLQNRLSYIIDPDEATKHKQILERTKKIKTFKALGKIKIGEITVTPLFVDHSAFDAYMFIVEAENKRILHTGDFRGHGFRSKGLIPTLRKYAKNIDFIISEGSNIQRHKSTIITEQQLQKDFKKQFSSNKFNFVFVSSTNIDRIFSLYHATKSAGRCFVCDKYQSKMLRIVSEKHRQHSSFYDIDFDQIKSPAGRFIELNRSKSGASYSLNGKLKSYLESHGFCMLIRTNDTFNPLLDEYAIKDEGKVYYSMWKGYIDKKSTAFNEKTYQFFEPYEIEIMHTSGHADIEMLRNLFDTVNPKKGIIPIHTEAPDKFKDVFLEHTIFQLQDGELFNCDVE